MLEGRRIAHLIESDGPGGAERVVAHLASSLQAAGAENIVFVPANGEGWLARELAGTGVAIERFHLNGPLSPSCAAHLTATLRRRRVDLAHSHEFSMAVYGAWAARRARIPHVITMHGGRYYADRLRRRVALRAAIRASALTAAVSDDLARALTRDLWLHESRITTVPNGVPRVQTGRPALREELALTRDDRLLVAIGNLYPVKGHVYLIDALARLTERHPRAHLAIAGRGDLATMLAERARGLGLIDRVHLLGLRSDVGALLSSADVFVLPSLSEGLPLALLEAMFAGCPIVASDVGEIRRALGHGDAGVLVPPGDAEALASALDGVLANPDHARALGALAERRASEEYDITRMVGRYAAAYAREVATP